MLMLCGMDALNQMVVCWKVYRLRVLGLLQLGAMKGTNSVQLLGDIAWVELSDRCKMHKLCFMYKMVNKLAPCYLCNLCPAFVNERSCYSLRSGNDLCLPYVRTERHRKSFLFSTSQLWNSLLSEVRLSSSLSSFKNNVPMHIKGAFTRQGKNGTGPIKSGTVPITFVKKQ